MLRTVFLLTFYLSPIERVIGFGDLKLAIFNNDGEQCNNTFIVRNVNETLILVCKTKFDHDNKNSPKLSWILPTSRNRPQIPKPRYKMEGYGMTTRLIVEHLQESDSGPYHCLDKNGNNEDPPAIINLIIRRTFDCGRGVFCDNRCIHERFKCDGVPDCRNGKDEYTHTCGLDPCQDKIKCANGRCIPQSWCCNSSNENCTKKWEISCCPKDRRVPFQQDYNSISGSYHDSDVFGEYGDRQLYNFNDLNYLQTTIYAVFGCAILFMLIVTILVVVMQCKLQMRRKWQFQLLNRQRTFGNNTYVPTLNQESCNIFIHKNQVDIMDMVLEGYSQGNCNTNQQRNPNGLLVTYNINNGVQIVGKPVEPPPYTEVAPRPPLNLGPPPSYVPRTSEESGDTPTEERKCDRKQKRGLSKIQASSEPALTNNID